MKRMMPKTNSEVLQMLVTFGLTPDEARLYVALLHGGQSTARQLAVSVRILPNAVYRLLQNLERSGLIVSSGNHPNTFKSLPPSIAFEALAKKRIAGIEQNKERILACVREQPNSDQTKLEIIGSKREFFRSYVDLAKKARKYVDIVSIGEEIPEEIMMTNRDCLEHGVAIRFIVHKYDADNSELLGRWVRMGLSVRHYADWGYHLVIVDGTKSILATNNPKNTDDRMAIKIYSEGLSKALGDYFDALWEKAVPVAV